MMISNKSTCDINQKSYWLLKEALKSQETDIDEQIV